MKLRLNGGFANCYIGGKVDHGVEPLRQEQVRDGTRVQDVQFMEGNVANVVLVAAREIVHHHYVETALLQYVSGRRSDITGAAGHQDLGHKTLG